MKAMKELLRAFVGIIAISHVAQGQFYQDHRLHPRADCRTIKAQENDGCESLAKRCGISQKELNNFNSADNFCSSIEVGQQVCCSAGDLPDLSPQPDGDGGCATYAIQKDESCSTIAEKNHISSDDIEKFNGDTWGWAGCKHLQPDQRICLSEGDPPMPASLPNAICGPQVNGTKRPTDGTKLQDLNPCPLNVCCNVWGQCGTTEEFCIESPADTGAPGTSKPGKNGCISNCGMDVVNNDDPPARFSRVAYFETFNNERPCLHMDVTNIDTSKYTHVHFAFASISDEFQVDVSKVQDQFERLKSLTGINRILSFGGWAFSTEAPTYTIFRDGVTAKQRETFANAVVDFVQKHGLDGVDFDWEYPSAPDIPGIPPGIKSEGQNYLEFLKAVKSRLPDQTVSIAAPASYWYLKGYPIKEIGETVDYIIYMTYDLHGQWDYGKEWTTPGCKEGNCLRSHVNITETTNSLSMITKAGVPASKIFAGITSYGRNFHMSQPGCTGPNCHYTGSATVSDAEKGPCTNTSGYISAAEIRDIIHQGASGQRNVSTYHDKQSNSDIVVYDEVQWLAWLSDTTKSTRTDWFQGLNLGGVSDWAVDLDGGGGLVQYNSPESATVIPFSATTVAPTETFTIKDPVVTEIQDLENEGDQNNPKGPGLEVCEGCDLARLITSTCCGIGGGVSNPITIEANTPIPRGLILPPGFRLNQEVSDSSGTKWKAGQVLPWEIVIEKEYVFVFPLEIPAGLTLSDTSSGEYADQDDDRTNGVLYITSNFWERPHTVSCSYPCTLLFPPIETTTTWTPSPFVTTVSSTSSTVTPPVQTTEKIRIKKQTITSDEGSSSTQTIQPGPAPDPLCAEITLPVLGTIHFGLCPPKINPFPPEVPDVTIEPVPPGQQPGPTNPGNKPTNDQKEEEEDDDDDDDDDDDSGSCVRESAPNTGSFAGDGSINDEPYIPDYEDATVALHVAPANAGTGSPTQKTVYQTVTASPTRPTVTETKVVHSPPPVPSPPPNPDPPKPNPDTEEKRCYHRPNREVQGKAVQSAIDDFCAWADGKTISNNNMRQVNARNKDILADVIVSVTGKNNCEFTITKDECHRILHTVVDCKARGFVGPGALRIGGEVESNCAIWVLDPIENLQGQCIPIPAWEFMCELMQTIS